MRLVVYQWLVAFIHLLNTTTRMPSEILFVMLIKAVVFPFALEIRLLHENEKKTQSSLVVVFSLRSKRNRLL